MKNRIRSTRFRKQGGTWTATVLLLDGTVVQTVGPTLQRVFEELTAKWPHE